MASHPSPGFNHRSTGGGFERTQFHRPLKLIQLHMPQDLPLFSIFRAASTDNALLPKATFRTSIQVTSVYPVPDLRLFPASTPFWPYGTHPFFPHSHQTSQTLHLKKIHFPSLSTSLTHASAPYNAVSTITHSYRHFLAFISNRLLLNKLFSAPQALYPSFIPRLSMIIEWDKKRKTC